MTQPLFPSTIGTQSRSVKFLTIKNRCQTNDGQTGSQCFDKAVLEQTEVHCTSKQNVVMSRRTHPKHDTAPVSLYNWHTITFC